jgi:hypothetical protein
VSQHTTANNPDYECFLSTEECSASKGFLYADGNMLANWLRTMPLNITIITIQNLLLYDLRFDDDVR